MAETRPEKLVCGVITFHGVSSETLIQLVKDWKEGFYGHRYKSLNLGQDKSRLCVHLITFTYALTADEKTKDFISSKGRKLQKRFGKNVFLKYFSPIQM